MNQRVVYFNGKFVPESEAKVSIYDFINVWRYSFEMTRSFNKQHFKLKEILTDYFLVLKS